MQRRYPRYPIQVPLLYSRLDQEEAASAGIGWTQDLSEGGACLELQAQLPVGSRLGLVIFANPETFEAETRVVWVRGRDQETFHHGVEFLHLTPTHLQSLLKALPQEKSFREQAIRLPITLPVYCQAADTPPLEGWTGDISRTGVMIFLPQQLPTNTKVEITLQAAQGQLRLAGQVRWVDASRDGVGPIRHGIEFLERPIEAHRLLSLFLGTLTEESWERRLSVES